MSRTYTTYSGHSAISNELEASNSALLNCLPERALVPPLGLYMGTQNLTETPFGCENTTGNNLTEVGLLSERRD